VKFQIGQTCVSNMIDQIDGKPRGTGKRRQEHKGHADRKAQK
jgi:hypothetical protein